MDSIYIGLYTLGMTKLERSREEIRKIVATLSLEEKGVLADEVEGGFYELTEKEIRACIEQAETQVQRFFNDGLGCSLPIQAEEDQGAKELLLLPDVYSQIMKESSDLFKRTALMECLTFIKKAPERYALQAGQFRFAKIRRHASYMVYKIIGDLGDQIFVAALFHHASWMRCFEGRYGAK
jgi:hypothetical protein